MLLRIAPVLLGLGIALASGSATASATDTDVLVAREAAQKGNIRVLESLRPRFVGHPLEAYPAFWLLSGRLDKAEPGTVRAFLERHADTPLAETLRREWLRVLGAAEAWDLFRAEHPRLASDDNEIACYALQARRNAGDAEALDEARSTFLKSGEMPAACDPLFAAVVAEGKVGSEDVWDRIRRLGAAGHVRDAKRAGALLPAPQRIPEKQLDQAYTHPAKAVPGDKQALANRAAKVLAVIAISRLARSKPEEAAERLAALAPRLEKEDLRFAWGQIAHQAALQHHPRALDWYAEASEAPLADGQVAWKIRAALRAGQWKAVLAGIEALPPAEARDPTWRYWKARSLRALGSADEAQSMLAALARESGYYALLAAEDLGTLPTPDWNGWRPAAEDLDRVRGRPGIERALILYRVGLDNEALREWLWAIRGWPDRDLLAAAEVARLANVPDRAINTANRTVQLHDYAQRYPTPHRDALAAAARQWDLDEALVYGIIRQESRFMAHARSRVGATGLMQLMPATARWVARQIPVNPFSTAMLTQPELNVNMGSYYFRRVLTALGDTILATAAYNAGPGRARRWRDERPLEGAIYVETIPFNETRDYVKQVLANTYYYSHRLKGAVPSMRGLLGTVPGRNGETPEAMTIALP